MTLYPEIKREQYRTVTGMYCVRFFADGEYVLTVDSKNRTTCLERAFIIENLLCDNRPLDNVSFIKVIKLGDKVKYMCKD